MTGDDAGDEETMRAELLRSTVRELEDVLVESYGCDARDVYTGSTQDNVERALDILKSDESS